MTSDPSHALRPNRKQMLLDCRENDDDSRDICDQELFLTLGGQEALYVEFQL